MQWYRNLVVKRQHIYEFQHGDLISADFTHNNFMVGSRVGPNHLIQMVTTNPAEDSKHGGDWFEDLLGMGPVFTRHASVYIPAHADNVNHLLKIKEKGKFDFISDSVIEGLQRLCTSHEDSENIKMLVKMIRVEMRKLPIVKGCIYRYDPNIKEPTSDSYYRVIAVDVVKGNIFGGVVTTKGVECKADLVLGDYRSFTAKDFLPNSLSEYYNLMKDESGKNI
jgi:hypothetical protein